jgi:RHS repeat-associated protein
VFASLRLNRTTFEAGEYVRSKLSSGVTTVFETLYIGSFARVVYADSGIPIRTTAGKQHVFFQVGDVLGSTSVVFDKATSETVEKITYDAWGRTESDYRPARWASFREDYRFTEKEEDIEVGLTYFGARYYSPYIGRWASPDPLQIHAGGGDPNPYAYVRGKLAQSTDPTGLIDSDESYDGPPVTPTSEWESSSESVNADGSVNVYIQHHKLINDSNNSERPSRPGAEFSNGGSATRESFWNQRPNTGSPFGVVGGTGRGNSTRTSIGAAMAEGAGAARTAAAFFGLGGAAIGAGTLIAALAPPVLIGIGIGFVVGAVVVIAVDIYQYKYPTIAYGRPTTLAQQAMKLQGEAPSPKGYRRAQNQLMR